MPRCRRCPNATEHVLTQKNKDKKQSRGRKHTIFLELGKGECPRITPRMCVQQRCIVAVGHIISAQANGTASDDLFLHVSSSRNIQHDGRASFLRAAMQGGAPSQKIILIRLPSVGCRFPTCFARAAARTQRSSAETKQRHGWWYVGCYRKRAWAMFLETPFLLLPPGFLVIFPKRQTYRSGICIAMLYY